jgi:uncharacterized protein
MISRRLFFFSMLLCLSLIAGERNLVFSGAMEDPLDGREERLRVFREKRDRFFGEDPQSPLGEKDRKAFKGLRYYPVDLKYALTGKIERHPVEPNPIYVTLSTSKGSGRKYVKYGRFDFKIDGKRFSLAVYRPVGGSDLFLPFKDRTSETETHREGRYLPVEERPDGTVLIDFNRAYNPFCEFNEKYTCPLAPRENWLDLPIQAGEKRFR